MFGVCRCDRSYFGAACEQQLQQCPTAERTYGGVSKDVECGGNGLCERDDTAAKCVCHTGYEGDACDRRKTCASECKNDGKCNPFTGMCLCRYGYSGDACENERKGLARGTRCAPCE